MKKYLAIGVAIVACGCALSGNALGQNPTSSVQVQTNDGFDSQSVFPQSPCGPPPHLCYVPGGFPLAAYTTPTIHAQVVGSPGNDGHAKIGSLPLGVSGQGVGMGIEVRTSGPGRFHNARADFSDNWAMCPAALAPCNVPAPFPNYLAAVITGLHVDGVLDDLFVHPTSDPSFMELKMFYRVTGDGAILEDFSLDLCYDSGPCGITATLNGVDISNLIKFGTNAMGQTTMSLDTTSKGFRRTVDTWSDELFAQADIESSTSAANHVIDFLNTFRVDVTSLDPNVVWQSQTGRVSARSSVDTIPPTTTASLSVPPNAAGWNTAT